MRLIISDTNILSSLAAAESLNLLFRLFPDSQIYIPPAVYNELQAGLDGLDRSRIHLEFVLQAIDADTIQILDLSAQERRTLQDFPKKLNSGEREAIALAQSRQSPLLSNDKRAIYYCQQQNIKIIDLPDLLRLLWTRRIVSRAKVRQLIRRMKQVENLVFNETDWGKIFAPRSHSRRRRRKS